MVQQIRNIERQTRNKPGRSQPMSDSAHCNQKWVPLEPCTHNTMNKCKLPSYGLPALGKYMFICDDLNFYNKKETIERQSRNKPCRSQQSAQCNQMRVPLEPCDLSGGAVGGTGVGCWSGDDASVRDAASDIHETILRYQVETSPLQKYRIATCEHLDHGRIALPAGIWIATGMDTWRILGSTCYDHISYRRSDSRWSTAHRQRLCPRRRRHEEMVASPKYCWRVFEWLCSRGCGT
jgi:hypothetical protein